MRRGRVLAGLVATAGVLGVSACSMPFADRIPVVVTVTPTGPASAQPDAVPTPGAPNATGPAGAGTPASDDLATPFVSGSRDWTDVAKQVSPAVVRLDVAGCDTRVVGSGFFVDQDLVVTSGHVASGASAMSVQYAGGVIPALVVGINRKTDTALLRTARPVAPATLRLASGAPATGAAIGILGYPYGTFNLHATEATVVGAGPVDYGTTKVDRALETDANITDGNTGAPVVDHSGAVVGIVTGSPLWVSGSDQSIAQKKAKRKALGLATTQTGSRTGVVDPARVRSTGFVVPAPDVTHDVDRWRDGPNRDLLGCYSDVAPVVDDPFALTVDVQSGHSYARDVAAALALHGQALNAGSYEVAYEVFTPRMQGEQEGLDAWRAGLQSVHWDHLTIKSLVGTGNVVEAKVTLRTTQEAAHGHSGQTCSLTEQGYTLRTSGGGWLIDRVRTLDPPTAC